MLINAVFVFRHSWMQ